MKKLKERDVIRVMQEEWNARVKRALSEIDLNIFDDKKDALISSGLKVFHKKSKIRYTVNTVSAKNVILVTPEGDKIMIDTKEFEDQYELV